MRHEVSSSPSPEPTRRALDEQPESLMASRAVNGKNN